MKILFTYYLTTDHVYKNNYLIPVYSFSVHSFSVKQLQQLPKCNANTETYLKTIQKQSRSSFPALKTDIGQVPMYWNNYEYY